jgi:hypothetical protein
MARPRKSGKRIGKRLSRSKESLMMRNPPADYILERRNLFAFATPTKGPDGRHGELDQDICDGIGQLHILGLLDGHGFDGKDLRDAGRFYGDHYWSRYKATAPRVGQYERVDRSVSEYLGETAADRRFDRMDTALQGYERDVLMSLVVDKAWGDEIAPWAQSLIDEALSERRKFRKAPIMFPTEHERGLLAALIRALCVILDGGMEMRRAA